MFNLRSSNTFWLNEQYLQGCTYLPFELLAFTGGKWLKDFPVSIVVTLSGIGRGEQKGHEFKASPAALQIPVYIDKSFHAKIDNMVCVCVRMRMLVHTCYNFIVTLVDIFMWLFYDTSWEEYGVKAVSFWEAWRGSQLFCFYFWCHWAPRPP